MADASAQSISWTFPEYEYGHRTIGWCIGAGIVGMGIFLFAVFTANYLFASITVFIATIYALQHYRRPLRIRVTLALDGIALEERRFAWKDLKCFWILYEPPEVKNLYFEFKGLRPRLKIPLHDQNPLSVREHLLPYLDEDLEKEGEPLSDTMGRTFKL